MYKIEIPGVEIFEPREYRYILINENEKFENKTKGIFSKITTCHEEPLPEGGILAEGFIIVTPNNEKYYGLSYRGNIEGWRKEIEKNAELDNRKFGKIINKDIFWINDNTEYNLKDCEYYGYGYLGKDHKPIKKLIHFTKYFDNNIIKLMLEDENIL
jgi:hypothetical protein